MLKSVASGMSNIFELTSQHPFGVKPRESCSSPRLFKAGCLAGELKDD